ncbi:MAG: nicotinate (nicotinamide) nucleotide adenylyltransferase, partial [Planctomicrobium sp.]|nr:nicotinate (nicotinamide) nucleotide adenylyltransferase [Planctomicrobium sp.]
MKIGIYGGTFDPVHLGHLILAETVREQLELDEVWFVPAFQNPLKADRPVTPPKSRLEMLRFAIAGNPNFRLKEDEVKRKGASYTFETIQKFKLERPDDHFYLMIGADSLAEFPNWREPKT